ncbi:hypothetical protein DB346_24345 [Verrucomicrobia bacterium LW23]|nr:hypothetical protein DB346_24345 [Verrucomicrobia bacterium LW23]
MTRRSGNIRKSEFIPQKEIHIIAMEGCETEYIYLDELKQYTRDNVKLVLLKNINHKTKPTDVLSKITTYFKHHEREESDKAWILIDRDAWTVKELNKVCKDAKLQDCRVLLTNPCVELWFHYHLANEPINDFFDRDDCQGKLCAIFPGYTKAKYNVKLILDKTLSKVAKAVRIAKSTDLPGSSVQPWPQRQTTRVYLLIQEVLQLPEDVREVKNRTQKERGKLAALERGRKALEQAGNESIV